MTHNTRCSNAKTPTCHCSCKGDRHNPNVKAKWTQSKTLKRLTKELEDPDAKLMTLEMGGEVAEKLNEFLDKEFLCLGVCGKSIIINEIHGYAPHDAGYADSTGKKWWMFVHCFRCGYDTALWKIPNRMKSLELERQYHKELEA